MDNPAAKTRYARQADNAAISFLLPVVFLSFLVAMTPPLLASSTRHRCL